MSAVVEFAQEFYSKNPEYLTKPIDEVLSEIEKALKSAQKTAKEALAQKEATKAHGASILHAIFDESGLNVLPSAVVFVEYSWRIAATTSKGKQLSLPTKETKAQAEKSLREVVFDGETFLLTPGKGAKQEAVHRLLDADGNTIANAPTATIPPAAKVPSVGPRGSIPPATNDLVALVKRAGRSGIGGGELRKSLGLEQAGFTKVINVALERGEIRKEGNKRATKYYLA